MQRLGLVVSTGRMPHLAFALPSVLLSLLSMLQAALAQAANINGTLSLGPSAFTVPGAFPTSVYSSYYNDPTQTSAQVQPVISDPVSVRISLLASKFINIELIYVGI